MHALLKCRTSFSIIFCHYNIKWGLFWAVVIRLTCSASPAVIAHFPPITHALLLCILLLHTIWNLFLFLQKISELPVEKKKVAAKVWNWHNTTLHKLNSQNISMLYVAWETDSWPWVPSREIKFALVPGQMGKYIWEAV